MLDFKNKIALVTGASGNLGEATVRAFHTAGAKVVAVSRKLDHLNETFQSLDNIICAAADLTDETYVQTMANEVLEKVGRVDILVNVAGGFTMGPTVHETDLKTWAFM
ncbi:MAG: SDR family NAD(P)-dependent oxidoreductase, partial [Anaerolineales bacterium]|nr:SDR family NAD(P)-dependent oxidoreductase [Anaerolineales bacterium]